MVREPYSGSVFQKNAAGWTGGVETSRAYYTTPAPKMEEEISPQINLPLYNPPPLCPE